MKHAHAMPFELSPRFLTLAAGFLAFGSGRAAAAAH